MSTNKKITSGAHLAIIRNWMIWNARNGDQVSWGSNDILQLRSLSAGEMEALAQEIADAAKQELIQQQQDDKKHNQMIAYIKANVNEPTGSALTRNEYYGEYWAKLYKLARWCATELRLVGCELNQPLDLLDLLEQIDGELNITHNSEESML